MKVWEVIKGMDEQTYLTGDLFEITFPDGSIEYAKIGTYNCLWFVKNGIEIQMVYFGINNKSVWRFLSSETVN